MIKTVILTGEEQEVSDLGGFNTVVHNLGENVIFASKYPNIAEGADNVAQIPAGSAKLISTTNGTVYLLGTGTAELTGQDHDGVNLSASSGGDYSVIKAYIDDCDIKVLDSAKSYTDEFADVVNVEITDLKTGKADKSEIPTVLPASGGNADTVNGHSVESDVPANAVFSDTLYTAEDKAKLDGIAVGANNYVHPTNAGNKHIPSGGTDNQILAYSADGTAKWSETCNAAAFDAVIGTVSSSNRTIAYKPGRTKVLLFMWRNATVDNLSNFVFDTMLIKNMSSSMTAKEIGTMNSGLNTVCTISVDASGNVIVAPGDSVNNKYLAIWFN